MQELDAKPNTFLSRLASLAPLTMDDRRAVLRLLGPVSRPIRAGVDLTKVGMRLEQAIIVLDGLACRYKVRKNGKRQNLAYLLPGDINDLDDVILSRVTSHSVATLLPCGIVQVPAADLLHLIERHPQVARALRLVKLIDEAIAREWIMRLGSYSAAEQIAHLLCEMLVRLKAVGLVKEDNSYDFPVSQSVIGDTLGLSDVHVNRSLQSLRHKGWITFERGRLQIHEMEQLRQYAEFSATYLDAGVK